MYWTIHLEGGPRRVNHASVSTGDLIYSFGGYCSGEAQAYTSPRPMDVHVLNTHSLRWKLVYPKRSSTQETEEYPYVPFQR